MAAREMKEHWDKFALIPGRPDEFLFIMGVSNSLLYSALPSRTPYPERPVIASTTRADFSEYIFGTPVMHIDTHSSRITALAVSLTGSMSAAGDESGFIKLLVLTQLKEFNIKQTQTSSSGSFAVPKSQLTGSNFELFIFLNDF